MNQNKTRINDFDFVKLLMKERRICIVTWMSEKGKRFTRDLADEEKTTKGGSPGILHKLIVNRPEGNFSVEESLHGKKECLITLSFSCNFVDESKGWKEFLIYRRGWKSRC